MGLVLRVNMSIPNDDKLYQEFKDLIDKESKGESKKTYTEQDYREAYINFTNFAEVIYEQAKRHYFRKQKLKKSPKGIHLEEDGSIFNCLICHRQISGKEGWWDEDGQRCMDCQRAIKEKLIPRSVLKDRDSWYADWELKSKFNIHPSTVRKLAREGKLKARLLRDKNGNIYEHIFIKKENPNLVIAKR